MSEIRIGISGWTYPLWRGTFYPEGLSIKREFQYATERFSTIEVNGTFYRLQKPDTFRNWYENSPANIKFAIKGNRYITHVKRLKDPAPMLANFFATGPLELQQKLGPILWQFPPRMKFDAGRFREFFEALPRTPKEAMTLARKHDLQIEGDDTLVARSKAKLRYAVEIRDDSFKNDEFIDLLREYGIAYVIADTADRWVYAEDLTADFVYMRLHGYKELYKGGYTDEALDVWAERIKCWHKGKKAPDAQTISSHKSFEGKTKDVFTYFDNDAKVNAPYDAATLMRKLRKLPALVLPIHDPEDLVDARKGLTKKERTALQPRAISRKVKPSART
jgi:uncharacterized protein YecE (DUF72 family)